MMRGINYSWAAPAPRALHYISSLADLRVKTRMTCVFVIIPHSRCLFGDPVVQLTQLNSKPNGRWWLLDSKEDQASGKEEPHV